MWVDAPDVWIPSEDWNKNQSPAADYKASFIEKAQEFGSFAALDLSTVTDLSALVFITNPDLEGKRYLLPYFFCPKATIDVRSKEDRVPYRYWADAGYLIATPGNTVDYSEIKKTVLTVFIEYNTRWIEFDQWNAEHLRNEIAEEGIETSFFSQAIGVISAPTKEFERLVYEGNLIHGGHPILNWCLSGCVIYKDANENIKVHKGRSHMGKKRVDGIIASIMALGGSMTIEDESNKSQYNDPEKEITFGIETE